MFMKLNLTDKFGGKFENPRCQCYCGAEYTPSPDSGCPACGKLVPRALASEEGPWMTPQQWKVEMLRRALEPDALDQVPEEHRDLLRQNLKRQIRQLEDGSWKAETKQRIHGLRRMLTREYLERIPADEREKATARVLLHIKRLEEELAIAGETVGEEAPPASPFGQGPFLTGVFARPKVTAREWEEDPMLVMQKVSMAITLHIQHDKMTPLQRRLVHAWYYTMFISEGSGGHGHILFNRVTDVVPSEKYFLEALESILTPAHKEVFEKALEQWDSKPRNYPEPPRGDREALATWSEKTWRPLCEKFCEEFREFDKQAAAIQPSMEACLTAFLRQHQDEFVEVLDKL